MFPWKKGSLIVPPDKWFHQHFNSGTDPARYLALRWGSDKYGVRAVRMTHADHAYESAEEGGDQIEYPKEDPKIMEIFREQLQSTAPSRRCRSIAGASSFQPARSGRPFAPSTCSWCATRALPPHSRPLSFVAPSHDEGREELWLRMILYRNLPFSP